MVEKDTSTLQQSHTSMWNSMQLKRSLNRQQICMEYKDAKTSGAMTEQISRIIFKDVVEQSDVVIEDGMADVDGHWHADNTLQVQLRPGAA